MASSQMLRTVRFVMPELLALKPNPEFVAQICLKTLPLRVATSALQVHMEMIRRLHMISQHDHLLAPAQYLLLTAPHVPLDGPNRWRVKRCAMNARAGSTSALGALTNAASVSLRHIILRALRRAQHVMETSLLPRLPKPSISRS